MTSISKKILGVYLLVLALGFTLSTLIYVNGQAVSATTNSLVEIDLPRRDQISKLRIAIFLQKPVLYEYYATADHDVFLKKFEANQSVILEGLRAIRGEEDGRALLAQIEVQVKQIAELARQLDQTFTSPPTDWDRAREILVQVSETADKITPLIDALVSLNQKHVSSSGAATQSRTQFMVQLVIVFSIVIFIIAILVGYYVNAYIAENAERRALVMFPERNPSAVLRTTWEGKIAYSNPATTELLSQLGLASAEGLLPQNFTAQLAALKSSGRESVGMEYTTHNHVLEFLIHMLADLQIFHIYISDITNRKNAEEKLVYQAYHDDLTDLPNRRMFGERLRDAITQAGADSMLVVALFRIDRIKRVLEGQGYEASDNILRAMALRLGALLQENHDLAHGAVLFRLEGATFGMLLPAQVGTQQLLLLGEKLQASMREPLHVNEQELFFTLSIGASIYPQDGRDSENLIKNAEAAVSRVSAQGGNTLQCYTQNMNDQAERGLSLENGLRRCLERNELTLNYQPQVEISSNRVLGVEALLRWKQDGKNSISPAEFIPLAEESGLIIPIGEWVLHTACLQAKAWHNAGVGNLVMAVNISARQFQHPGFVGMVSATINKTGIDPNYLELEISESVAMHDAEKTIATLNELRAMNLQLSIDDFGTGYSSLSYLKRFPINKLKVDQSFVRNMTVDRNDASISKAIILLGQSLNLKVIAEGVETAEQLALLQQFGCDEVQGYFFSKPLPNADLEKFLLTRII